MVLKFLKLFFNRISYSLPIFYVITATSVVCLGFAVPPLIFTPSSPLHVISLNMLTFIAVFSVYSITRFSGADTLLTVKQITSADRNQAVIFLLAPVLFFVLQIYFFDSISSGDLIGASFSFVYVRSMDVLTAAFNLTDFIDPLRGKVLKFDFLSAIWVSFIHSLFGPNLIHIPIVKAFQNLLGFIFIRRIFESFSHRLATIYSLCISVGSVFIAISFPAHLDHSSFLSFCFLLHAVYSFRMNREENLLSDFYAIVSLFAFLYLSELDSVLLITSFTLHTFMFFTRSSFKSRMLFLLSLFLYLPVLYKIDSVYAQAVSENLQTAKISLSPAGIYFALKTSVLFLLPAFLLFRSQKLPEQSVGNRKVLCSSVAVCCLMLFIAELAKAFLGITVNLSLSVAGTIICASILPLINPSDFLRKSAALVVPWLTAFFLAISVTYLIASYHKTDMLNEIVTGELSEYPSKKTLIISSDSSVYISRGFSSIPPDIVQFFINKIEYRLKYKLIDHVIVILKIGSRETYPQILNDILTIESEKTIHTGMNSDYKILRTRFIEK